jgi:hypothetical protein
MSVSPHQGVSDDTFVFHVSFRWFTNYNKKQEISAYINEDQWSVYQQYDAALEPLKDFSEFCQSVQVIVHWELFEANQALEWLSAPFFEMYGNLSSQNQGTSRMATDLTKRQEMYLDLDKEFVMPRNKQASKCDNLSEAEMLPSIKLAHCLAWCQFSVRLGFIKSSNTVSEAKSSDLDTVVASNLMAGMQASPSLGDYKMIGSMLKPLMQSLT